MGIEWSLRAPPTSLVVLCDFDGTVVDIDTSVFVLTRFAEEDWRTFDGQLERGKITLGECLRKQFSTVRATKTRILKEIENVPSVRPNFEKLAEFCKTKGIPLMIVSAGLDFVINHFLEQKGWQKLVTVYAPKARITAKGIKFTFPKLLDKASVSFKDDLVRYYKKQGKTTIYIGDGFADFNAAKNADFSFAIEDSKLAELLKNDGIPHKEISDFQEVVKAIIEIDLDY